MDILWPSRESGSEPRIELIGPHMDGETVLRDQITVMGRIEGPEGTDVLVDGVKAEVRAGGQVDLFVAKGVPLEAGNNTIAVIATTPEGKHTEETFEATYKPLPEPPVRELTAAAKTSTSGTTITVSSTDDSVDANPGDGECATAVGACTLRAAVQETNALSGQDTVQIPAGDYVLTIPGRDENEAATGDLDITDVAGLVIDGAGQDSTTIDANALDRVIDTQPYVSLNLRGVTITGGDAQWDKGFGSGGGIYVEYGDLTVSDSTIRSNTAQNDGGGIYCESDLTINRSTFRENSGWHGGGAYADYGDLEVNDSLFVNNEADGDGGALGHAESDTFMLSNSTIRNNTAARQGGGIVDHGFSFNDTEKSKIVNSLVEDNTAAARGGGISNYAASLFISDTTVSGNHVVGHALNGTWGGGGIDNWGEVSLRIERSTVQDNTGAVGTDGGGVASWLSDADFSVVNSTISGNRTAGAIGGGIYSASRNLRVDNSTVNNNLILSGVSPSTGHPFNGNGGGIYAYSPDAEITNTTVSANIAEGGYGGGLANDWDAKLHNVTLYGNIASVGSNLMSWRTVLEGTLLTDNTDGENCATWDSFAESIILSHGNNLDSGDSCGFDQPTDLINTDPLLGPPQDNGGSTRTHALQPGSPAIDAGGDLCPPTDQRGIERMQDGNGDGVALCDIGAFELEGATPPVPPATGKLKATVTAPDSLGVVDSTLTPNPFTVIATANYEGYDPIENVNVSLSTSPVGLKVENGSSIFIGTMNPGEERQVSWQVHAPELKTRRVYNLDVTASAPGVSTWNASSQIIVPALYTRSDPPPGEGDDQGKPEDENASGCDPINFVTGNVYEYREDLYVPGRGVPTHLVRYYNSRDPYEGPLGTGWTHTYNVSLEENADGSIEEMDPQGKRLVYTNNQDGSYTEQKGFHDRLTKDSDGTFTLVRKESRDRWRFDADGILTGISDSDGNALTFIHDTQGLLTGITDSAGRRTTLEYDVAGHLTALTDPIGKVTRYAYDAGNLVSVTDPLGNAVRYEYDAKHNLTRILDKTGGEFLFTYDDQDRAASARAGDGTWAVTLAYDPANNKTTVTDSNGGKSVFHYNEMSRITRLEQPDGTTLDYTFDSDGNRTSRTDANAATAHAVYDQVGNPVEVTMADGATTRTTYDEDNNPTSVTDALGNVTRYTYDDRGNLISETDALGNTTIYEYDFHGQLIKATKSSGKTNPDGTPVMASTTYTYDAQGNRISETDALGDETTYTYDAMGRMTSTTDARGNETRYQHDALGRVTKVTNPDGTTVLTRYDAAGNPIEATDENGRVTRTTYDPRSNPTSITDPAGSVTRYEYDTEGNLISETDALGNRTIYKYDALGRKTAEIKPDATTNPDGTPGTVTTTYAYDAAGNLVSTTDPLRRVTRMAYDAAGRLTKVTDPKGGIATYEYDLLGRRTKATNPNGHATTYEYDDMGRLTKETDPLLNATTYTYDAAGNQKSRTDAEGRRTTYTYDAANRLTATTYPNGTEVRNTYDAVGNLTSISDETGLYSFAYDVRNRPVSETWPGNRIIGYKYDAAGNRTALVHPDGKKVLYTYDTAGRMASVTDREGARTTYTYDALGRPKHVSYPNATGEEYAYDPLGRTTSVTATSPDGSVLARQGYAYDDASNPVTLTDMANRKSSFAYDDLDRLTSETSPGGQTTTYTYDAAGNRTSMTKGKTTTAYTYDAAERMTQAGTTTYVYNNDGSLTSVKSGKKTISTYAYDYEGMMTRADNINYARDPLGRVVSSTGATSTRYLFDGQQPVEEQTGMAAPNYYARGLNQQLISRRSGSNAPAYYHHDAIGSVTGLSGPAGTLTDTYAYDAFGNVTDRTGRTTQPYQYLSNAYDPTTKLYDFHARMYDPAAGRFFSEDPVDGLPTLTQTMNPYVYGVNNPLAHPDPGGMLIADFNDPLVPSGGDSPQNTRANKQRCNTDSEKEDCPGVNDLEFRWGIFQLYMDHCVTKHVVQFLSFGGGGVGLVSDLDRYVMKVAEFAQKAGAVVRLVTWADALALYTADVLGGGNGVILTAVTAPTLLIVTPQRK